VNRISRYVLKEIAAPSILAFAVISFVGIANELRERTDQLPVAFVTLGDVARLAACFLPTLVAYIVPVTYLMGILLAFGRLAQHNEITAMRAAGIPLKRVVGPVIAGGLALSVCTALIQDRVQPWAAQRLYAIMAVELPLRIGFDTLPPGVMHEYAGWRVYIGARDPDGSLRKVDILRPDEQGRPWVFYANTARVIEENGRKRIELHDGHIIPPEEGGGIMRSTFPVWTLPTPDVHVKAAAGLRRQAPLRDLFAGEREWADKTDKAPSRENRDELIGWRREIADRFAFPLACFAVSIVAAPLGVRAQHGGRSYSFGVGAAIFLVYFVLKVTMEPRSLVSLPEAILRGLAPNIVLSLAGVWFLRRVDRI